MTRHPGYSLIPNVTYEQWSELTARHQAGELSRLMLIDGTAYFRRATKKPVDGVEPFRPGATDPADRLIPRRITPPEAAAAYQTAATLRPDYSGENDPGAARTPLIAYLPLWLAASGLGAILARSLPHPGAFVSSVFEFLLAEKIVPAASAPALERYRTDAAFRAAVESRMLAQDRISLVTLAGPLPEGMGHQATLNLLYDMRHRFRGALEQLRKIDFDVQPAMERP